MNEEKNQNMNNGAPMDAPPPPPPPPPQQSFAPPPPAPGGAPAFDPQKKLLAGILAILVGAFGVHKFILGYQKEGFIMLGITVVGILTSCFLFGLPIYAMGIIGLVEGIMYLTKSDEDFYNTYIKNQKTWF